MFLGKPQKLQSKLASSSPLRTLTTCLHIHNEHECAGWISDRESLESIYGRSVCGMLVFYINFQFIIHLEYLQLLCLQL